MVLDAAVAPGVFLHGDLGASCAAALAVRSSGAARGPVLSAADRAACWRRDVLLSGIFGHHRFATVGHCRGRNGLFHTIATWTIRTQRRLTSSRKRALASRTSIRTLRWRTSCARSGETGRR